MEEITEEERAFVKKVNMDKAKNKSNYVIFLIAISLATYVFPLILKSFDFGIVFEIISIVMIIIARGKMGLYDIVKSKRYVIISMVAIGWILIYDLINLMGNVIVLAYYEWMIIIALLLMFDIIKDIDKADNPEKYKNNSNWFYENYDGKTGGEK